MGRPQNLKLRRLVLAVPGIDGGDVLDRAHALVVVASGGRWLLRGLSGQHEQVVSVGGTSLYLNGSGGYCSEDVWWDDVGGTGSGCSSLNSAPSWLTSASNWSSTGVHHGHERPRSPADSLPGFQRKSSLVDVTVQAAVAAMVVTFSRCRA